MSVKDFMLKALTFERLIGADRLSDYFNYYISITSIIHFDHYSSTV